MPGIPRLRLPRFGNRENLHGADITGLDLEMPAVFAAAGRGVTERRYQGAPRHDGAAADGDTPKRYRTLTRKRARDDDSLFRLGGEIDAVNRRGCARRPSWIGVTACKR